MPNKCSVPECSGRGGFSFPSDPGQRLKWKEAIKITWTPTAWSTVCDYHFKPDDFKDSIRAEEPVKKRRRVLKSSAVPSIFTWCVDDAPEVVDTREITHAPDIVVATLDDDLELGQDVTADPTPSTSSQDIDSTAALAMFALCNLRLNIVSNHC